MKFSILLLFLLFTEICFSQPFDTTKYKIEITQSEEVNKFFTKNSIWRGADGASSIDLENGKVLWLFSDGFISSDQSGSRKRSFIVRNSIAIQDGYDLETASVNFYWNNTKRKPKAFFHSPGKFWFWTGHGVMINDRLIIFLIQEKQTKKGIGFEAVGWSAALITNPSQHPGQWKIKYIKGPNTFGTIAGSASVLKDKNYLYAYGAVEPATHEVYLLRWKLSDAYYGNLSSPEWWIDNQWQQRTTMDPIPEPLFIGATEYSVHFDSSLNKYIQIQSFGFGEGKIGIRMSDSINGQWTEPHTFYTPEYLGVKNPFMYSAKAHPELGGNGIYITYNVNSFDFSELVNNQTIYFPRFLLVKITESIKN